jgi:hypothetical protein
MRPIRGEELSRAEQNTALYKTFTAYTISRAVFQVYDTFLA